MKDKVKSVFDDYREFFEKLKRKIIGFVGNNLVFLSVMEENNDKVKLNLFNILSNVENNNFVIEGEDQREEDEEGSILKIEIVRVECRYQSKYDDICMLDKLIVNKDYRYEDNYERFERYDNGGYRDDYGFIVRGGGG